MLNNRLAKILDGWKHLVFPTPESEKIARQRLEICVGNDQGRNKCSMYSERGYAHCRVCLCPIEAKVRSFKLANKCPLDKWGPYALNTERA